MSHISTFVDKPAFSLGPRVVGRANIALGAVGSRELGTFSLNKAVGTLTSASIGSLLLSYGSAGTYASRSVRAGYGSFTGTLASPILHGRYGSLTGTLRSPVVRGAYGSHGTQAAFTVRGVHGSFSGTIQSPRIYGRQGSFAGSITTPFLRARYGSFTGTLRAANIRATTGSFNRISTLGTLTGRQGSYGTIVGPNFRGRYGSFSGTLTTQLMIIRGVGSIGTITGASIRGRYGSFLGSVVTRYGKLASGSFSGTLVAPLIRSAIGSFQRIAISRAIRIAGTVGLASGGTNQIRIGRQVGDADRSAIIFDRTAGSFYAIQVNSDQPQIIFNLQHPQGPDVVPPRGILNLTLATGGSIAGTIRGRVPINRITGAEISGPYFQSLGTKLGTISSSLTTRYAVWPIAFANANYRPIITVENRPVPDRPLMGTPQYATVAIGRRIGSMQYGIRSAAGNMAPGTIHIMAFAT